MSPDHTDSHPHLPEVGEARASSRSSKPPSGNSPSPTACSSAEDHRRRLEWMDAASPALGSRLVARAWVDPAFKDRALADGAAAAEELGTRS